MSDVSEIKERITSLETKMDSIMGKLDLLLEKTDVNAKECDKMGRHIDFVEGVYDTVKHPLSYICTKVSSFAGSNPTSIEDQDNMLLPDVSHGSPRSSCSSPSGGSDDIIST